MTDGRSCLEEAFEHMMIAQRLIDRTDDSLDAAAHLDLAICRLREELDDQPRNADAETSKAEPSPHSEQSDGFDPKNAVIASLPHSVSSINDLRRSR